MLLEEGKNSKRFIVRESFLELLKVSERDGAYSLPIHVAGLHF